MKTIDVSTRKFPGLFAIVDDQDYERVAGIIWTAKRLKPSNPIYAAGITENGGFVLMHRFIMQPPDIMVVDHIDHNGLNNSRSNLRIATRSENCRNRLKTCRPTTSRFKGVNWVPRDNRWVASIIAQGKPYYLGNFKSEIDAARAYNSAAIKLHKEFASLNIFPEIVATP